MNRFRCHFITYCCNPDCHEGDNGERKLIQLLPKTLVAGMFCCITCVQAAQASLYINVEYEAAMRKNEMWWIDANCDTDDEVECYVAGHNQGVYPAIYDWKTALERNGIAIYEAPYSAYVAWVGSGTPIDEAPGLHASVTSHIPSQIYTLFVNAGLVGKYGPACGMTWKDATAAVEQQLTAHGISREAWRVGV